MSVAPKARGPSIRVRLDLPMLTSRCDCYLSGPASCKLSDSIQKEQNIQQIRDAGMEDGVFPLHADAHSLPFAPEFFDASVCIDAIPTLGQAISLPIHREHGFRAQFKLNSGGQPASATGTSLSEDFGTSTDFRVGPPAADSPLSRSSISRRTSRQRSLTSVCANTR
jgi:hypothetical protein